MLDLTPIQEAAFGFAGIAATFRQGAISVAVTVLVGDTPQKINEAGDVLRVGTERTFSVRRRELRQGATILTPVTGNTLSITQAGGVYEWELLPISTERESQNADALGNVYSLHTKLKSIT